MSESRYDEKRAFGKTPEPPGEHAAGDVDPLLAPVGSQSVIQPRHATRVHYAVRLEMINGDTPVLVSWAVAKGLPKRRGEPDACSRRLGRLQFSKTCGKELNAHEP